MNSPSIIERMRRRVQEASGKTELLQREAALNETIALKEREAAAVWAQAEAMNKLNLSFQREAFTAERETIHALLLRVLGGHTLTEAERGAVLCHLLKANFIPEMPKYLEGEYLKLLSAHDRVKAQVDDLRGDLAELQHEITGE